MFRTTTSRALNGMRSVPRDPKTGHPRPQFELESARVEEDSRSLLLRGKSLFPGSHTHDQESRELPNPQVSFTDSDADNVANPKMKGREASHESIPGEDSISRERYLRELNSHMNRLRDEIQRLQGEESPPTAQGKRAVAYSTSSGTQMDESFEGKFFADEENRECYDALGDKTQFGFVSQKFDQDERKEVTCLLHECDEEIHRLQDEVRSTREFEENAFLEHLHRLREQQQEKLDLIESEYDKFSSLKQKVQDDLQARFQDSQTVYSAENIPSSDSFWQSARKPSTSHGRSMKNVSSILPEDQITLSRAEQVKKKIEDSRRHFERLQQKIDKGEFLQRSLDGTVSKEEFHRAIVHSSGGSKEVFSQVFRADDSIVDSTGELLDQRGWTGENFNGMNRPRRSSSFRIDQQVAEVVHTHERNMTPALYKISEELPSSRSRSFITDERTARLNAKKISNQNEPVPSSLTASAKHLLAAADLELQKNTVENESDIRLEDFEESSFSLPPARRSLEHSPQQDRSSSPYLASSHGTVGLTAWEQERGKSPSAQDPFNKSHSESLDLQSPGKFASHEVIFFKTKSLPPDPMTSRRRKPELVGFIERGEPLPEEYEKRWNRSRKKSTRPMSVPRTMSTEPSSTRELEYEGLFDHDLKSRRSLSARRSLSHIDDDGAGSARFEYQFIQTSDFSQDSKSEKMTLTRPEPFGFDAREKKRKETRHKTFSQRFLEQELAKKDTEYKVRFKARPVPDAVKKPLLEKMVNAERQRRDQVREKSKEITSSREAPFSFYERDLENVKQKQAWAEAEQQRFENEIKKTSTKARPIPPEISADFSKSFTIAEEERKARIQVRAQRLMSEAALPPRMEAHAHAEESEESREKRKPSSSSAKENTAARSSVIQRTRKRIPNFERLQKRFEESLQQARVSKPPSEPKPFSFYSTESQKDVQKIIRDMERDQEHMLETRWPYKEPRKPRQRTPLPSYLSDEKTREEIRRRKEERSLQQKIEYEKQRKRDSGGIPREVQLRYKAMGRQLRRALRALERARNLPQEVAPLSDAKKNSSLS